MWYTSAKNRLFSSDKGAVKVHAVEPVTSKVICQAQQYTHIAKNGIQWNLNPSQSQWGWNNSKLTVHGPQLETAGALTHLLLEML